MIRKQDRLIVLRDLNGRIEMDVTTVKNVPLNKKINNSFVDIYILLNNLNTSMYTN